MSDTIFVTGLALHAYHGVMQHEAKVGRAFCAKRYRLVEAAAGAVADAVLEQFPQVTAVRVVVHKPHAPIAATFDDVGVAVERARRVDGG
jgi:dihydroneopterin aldolase